MKIFGKNVQHNWISAKNSHYFWKVIEFLRFFLKFSKNDFVIIREIFVFCKSKYGLFLFLEIEKKLLFTVLKEIFKIFTEFTSSSRVITNFWAFSFEFPVLLILLIVEKRGIGLKNGYFSIYGKLTLDQTNTRWNV